MKKTYHTIDKQGKANTKKLAEFLVLTNDFDCWSVLAANQIDAINFNHLRPFGWRRFAHLA